MELKVNTATGIPAVQAFGSFGLNTDTYSFDNAKFGVEGGASYNLPGTYSLKLDISIFLQADNKSKEQDEIY